MSEVVDIVILVGIVTVSLIIGIFSQQKILPRVLKRLARRRSVNQRIIARQLFPLFFVWFTIIGYNLLFYLVDKGIYEFEDSIPIGQIRVWVNFILLVSILWFVYRLIGEFLFYYIKKGILPSTTIFINVTRLIILFLFILIVMVEYRLDALTGTINTLLATLGISALAIALALQDTLSNFFAGIYIATGRRVSQYDYIKLDTGEEGFVIDISWRSTTIRALENNLIIIPNRKMANLTVTNFTLESPEMSLVVPVSVHYDSDLEKVKIITFQVAREVLEEVDGAVSDFDPLIRFSELGEYAIKINVVLRVKNYQSQFLVKSEFINRLLIKYKEEGIIIPYPIQTLLHEEEGSVKPEKN